MNRPLPVRVVSSAARAIAEAADWWAANRPKAPDVFVTDLESALQLIASHPGIGARARNVNLEGVRRVHLVRLHYHMYYRVTSEPAIEVLALASSRLTSEVAQNFEPVTSTQIACSSFRKSTR